MQPIEIARKICEDVYGKAKTDLIAELVADDFVGHDPIVGKLDRAGLEANVERYHAALPGLKMEVLDSMSAGEKVMLRWRVTGTHGGELFGVQPTHRSVTIDGMTEVSVINGKVREAWDQWNAFALLRQIGAIPDVAGARPDGARGGARAQPRR